MVLDSQMMRPGPGGRAMMSRRRRGRRWPWLAAAVAAVLVVWLIWPGGGSSVEGEGGGAADRRVERQIERDGADDTTTRSSVSAPSDSTPGGAGAPSADGARATEARSEPRRSASPEPSASSTVTINGREEPAATPLARRQDAASLDRARAEAQPQRSGNDNGRTDSARTQGPSSGDAKAASPTEQARAAAQGSSGDFQHGMDLIADRHFVQGRRVLSRLLYSGQLSAAEARTVRDTLTSVNRELVFSDKVDPDDPIATTYEVQRGDLLSQIARSYSVPYRFVMQINGIQDARRVQAGQSIKLIKGPFHVRVDKSAYRMDLTIDGPDGEPIYIRSFPVGLGEHDSTPPGEWIVTADSKVTNPSWRNPRTGERFASDDPDNPLGGYWMGLTGVDDDTRDLRGYGIHGTIEPESIGTQASMGCIRLRDADIERVFHMLQEGQSRVSVKP